jgi:hypothetical protein
MLTLLLYVRTAWNDYFTGSPTPIQTNEYTSRQTHSSTNVYVLSCLFRSILSSNEGGAMHCSTSVTCLLVESTFFFSCKTSVGYGGAIYFTNTNNGQSVLYEVCGYDCYSLANGYHGQFVYIGMDNTASSKNYANYSSMVRCVNENSNTYYAFDLWYGKVCYSSVNSSMNNCSYGVNFCNPSSQSFHCSLSFCSFIDNVTTSHTCIMLSRPVNYEIKCCNIIRNMQSSSSNGITSAYGSAIIEDCCILKNTAAYIFWVYSSSYTITLSNCTVDSTSRSGNPITKSIITKKFHSRI